MAGKLKKQLGQYLLSDSGSLSMIAGAAEAGPDDTVLEIGPGTGNLTDRLLRTGATVVVVELDIEMCDRLAIRFFDKPRLEIVHADILTVDIEELAARKSPGRPMIATGNLPYYITTPIIMRLLGHGRLFSRIVLLLQDAVGRRIVARPGDSNRGSLTVACEVLAECRAVGEVSRKHFQPEPKVESLAIRLDVRPAPVDVVNMALFEKVMRAAFKNPRKTCYNSLRICLGNGILPGYTGDDPEGDLHEALRAADIPRDMRPHFLTLDQCVRLVAALDGKIKLETGDTE